MERFIIIHYSEIGLKKGNKDYFVKKLIKNIKLKFEKELRATFSVKHSLSRIIVNFNSDFSEAKYRELLDAVFGIKNYQFVYAGSLELKELGAQILDKILQLRVEAENFCVRVSRSQIWDYKSADAERDLGAYLIENGFNRKVKLKNPELLVNVEVLNNRAFFSFKKFKGLGGLPAGSGSKLISLISAGIDSPLAALKMIKRGARVIFVHFHAYPFSDQSEIENVKKLVGILSKYQMMSKLYLVPFGGMQKEISANSKVDPKYRVILYRRLMLKIAESISKKEEARGLITGDNYGQVASQTSENLMVISEATFLPIYRPLISFDKDEIIQEARKVGTYDISKQPCSDTCSMFVPKHPEIRANLFDAKEMESEFDVTSMVNESMREAEIISD